MQSAAHSRLQALSSSSKRIDHAAVMSTESAEDRCTDDCLAHTQSGDIVESGTKSNVSPNGAIRMSMCDDHVELECAWDSYRQQQRSENGGPNWIQDMFHVFEYKDGPEPSDA